MRRTVRLATGVAAISFVGLAGAPTALAQTVDCAVYPDACVVSNIIQDKTPPPPAPPADEEPADEEPADEEPADEEPADEEPADEESTDEESTSTEARSLPFTGGEVALLSLVGAGTLAAGTALVVAGRRRTSASG